MANGTGTTTPQRLEPPAAGAIIFYSNIGCPYAHAALHRLLEIRRDHGVDSLVAIDHRPLHSTSIRLLRNGDIDRWAATVDAQAREEPGAGWAAHAPAHRPETQLAHEMVQSAKAQGAEASVELDRRLRVGFFRDHLDLDTVAAVMSVAADVDGLDPDELETEFASGRGATEVDHHTEVAREAGIVSGPALATAAGEVVAALDVDTLEDLVCRAAASSPAE
ncbi:MAG: hypothetical protein RIB98_07465 [Acidimicrobiales bacterium]